MLCWSWFSSGSEQLNDPTCRGVGREDDADDRVGAGFGGRQAGQLDVAEAVEREPRQVRHVSAAAAAAGVLVGLLGPAEVVGVGRPVRLEHLGEPHPHDRAGRGAGHAQPGQTGEVLAQIVDGHARARADRIGDRAAARPSGGRATPGWGWSSGVPSRPAGDGRARTSADVTCQPLAAPQPQRLALGQRHVAGRASRSASIVYRTCSCFVLVEERVAAERVVRDLHREPVGAGRVGAGVDRFADGIDHVLGDPTGGRAWTAASP